MSGMCLLGENEGEAAGCHRRREGAISSGGGGGTTGGGGRL